MNRDEMCAMLAEAVSERMAVCTEQIAEALAGWEMVACKGAVIVKKGREIHCGATPAARGAWISRRLIREQLQTLVDRYGKAITSVLLENHAGHAFVRRLGFQESSRDGAKVYYELTELRHV